MRDEWMKAAPFTADMLHLLDYLLPRYGGDQAAAIRSAEFRQCMDAVVDATPGVADWLEMMPA